MSIMTDTIFFFISISRTHFNFFFFFNDTATTEIYTLSLHDALPISKVKQKSGSRLESEMEHPNILLGDIMTVPFQELYGVRSEEHTSELQSQSNLVCRLLLEKKKKS